MSDCGCRGERIEIAGGDDLTLKVCFFYPDNPTAEVFGEGDRILMRVKGDELYELPGEIVGKAGYFRLSGELTQTLADAERPFITYSVRILWADGEVSTPICGAPVVVTAC